jgi:hypothetical protein
LANFVLLKQAGNPATRRQTTRSVNLTTSHLSEPAST